MSNWEKEASTFQGQKRPWERDRIISTACSQAMSKAQEMMKKSGRLKFAISGELLADGHTMRFGIISTRATQSIDVDMNPIAEKYFNDAMNGR